MTERQITIRTAKLVNHFIIWARERGVERMAVSAYAANKRAIAFYQTLGFTPKSLSLELGLIYAKSSMKSK
jgi:GNAT superfamily N-acetyltransferase